MTHTTAARFEVGLDATTEPTSANVPDLMTRFRELEAATATTATVFAEGPADAALVEELIAWVMRQDFEPDRAERIRREAWEEQGTPVSATGAFGDLPLIADTSAWSKVPRAPAPLQGEFVDALRAGQVLGSPIVLMEWLHDARNEDEFRERERVFSGLREVPVTREVCDTALSALSELAGAGADGYHRVGLADALIAASAQVAGVNVLHDNPSDFERLAEVLAFTPVRFGPVP